MANNVDFKALWEKLVAAAQTAGDVRMKAALLNHASQKEYICRRLGVVCESDISRVSREFKRSGE